VARKKSIALSYAHQSLTEPGEWLEKVISAIRAEAIAVKAQAGQASSLSSSFGLTFDMVDEAAQEAINEADRLLRTNIRQPSPQGCWSPSMRIQISCQAFEHKTPSSCTTVGNPG